MSFLGATVILACRDEDKAKLAVEEVKEAAKVNHVEYMKLDLASLQSVRDFVKEFMSSKRISFLLYCVPCICPV